MHNCDCISWGEPEGSTPGLLDILFSLVVNNFLGI